MHGSQWALALISLGLNTANAAVVTSSFAQLSGSEWAVDLSITNDGTPAEITGFTVYFSEPLFAALAVDVSPPTWDSIAIQPDTALASAGYLDSFVLEPTSALKHAETQDGFRVSFTYLGAGQPPVLPYDIVDEAFQVVASGVTEPLTSPIPEPSTFLLAMIGIAGLVGKRHVSKLKNTLS